MSAYSNKINFDELKELVKVYIEQPTPIKPLFVTGRTGCGKTAAISKAFEEIGNSTSYMSTLHTLNLDLNDKTIMRIVTSTNL